MQKRIILRQIKFISVILYIGMGVYVKLSVKSEVFVSLTTCFENCILNFATDSLSKEIKRNNIILMYEKNETKDGG